MKNKTEKEEMDDDLVLLVNEIINLLKEAQRASNKLRWAMIRRSKGGYLHRDYDTLRCLLRRALFPCLTRIRRYHVRCMNTPQTR